MERSPLLKSAPKLRPGRLHRRVARELRRSLVVFALLMLLTGFGYPLLVTGIVQLTMSHQANGSIIYDDGAAVGSELIGQPFSSPQYFWGRPSATQDHPYNASASSGSNLGPNHPDLSTLVEQRIAALRAADPGNERPVPIDLVTASGSGLDPHISVAAAQYQVPRVARERNLTVEVVESLVRHHVEDRSGGLLGEPRVNVLSLNRDLDRVAAGGNEGDGALPRETSTLLGIPVEGWGQILLVIAGIVLLAGPIGILLHRVLQGHKGKVTRLVNRPADAVLRVAGVRQEEEMDWKGYALAMLMFNAVGIAVLFAMLMLQGTLPLNPLGQGQATADLAFNVAVSFGTNTNWQPYSPELTVSILTQMAGLAVQDFLAPATGIAVLLAFVRGLARRKTLELGNFWTDIIRSVLLLVLLSVILAVALASQGVPQTFQGEVTVDLLDPTTDAAGAPVTTQTILLGPVASHEAIKMLGTNGGGFYNGNSAHPLENPTPLSNIFQVLAMPLLAAALCVTFGEMVADRKQGWALLAAMTALLVLILIPCVIFEAEGNPQLTDLEADQVPTSTNIGGNMEGKEVRFGISGSALFAVLTTATSNGAVNSMHDSFTPLGGMMPLLAIDLGEVIYGGVGSGLYGMLAFVLLAAFIAGLVTGRMPVYLGNKLEPKDMRIAAALILLPVCIVLLGTALAVSTPEGRLGIQDPGPHGFTEVLYAYSSAGNNNGSAFAGLSANSVFYNLTLGIAMLLSRFGTALLTLRLADYVARKRVVPPSAGTLPTHTPTFITWLVIVVLLFGALSYFPAMALGPIADHLLR